MRCSTCNDLIVDFLVFDWWSLMGVSCSQELVVHSGSTVGFSCGDRVRHMYASHFACARFMMILRSTCTMYFYL